MKAAIFDMDGVLVDSEPIHQRTELDALAAFGLQLETRDLKPYAGTTRESFQNGIALQYNFHPDWESLFHHKDQRFYEMMEEVQSMPGVLNFIRDLQKSNIKLALATSGQKRSMEFVLNKFSLNESFSALVCANDVTHGKPHPEAFLIAADRLNIPPCDCVVFEDSVNGVKAAKAAGMYAIGIAATFPKEALHEADRIIESFHQINADEIAALASS
ncbi:MAG: HAD family phosphatase [Candidatus Omnitrophica bacterium]|nr:HAD family phosphatase [Candidatus Omnitrophota bacterium]